MDQVKKSAFTLVELLAVMAIMGIMMAIAVAAFLEYGRGVGMRGSSLQVQSGLSQARQQAITLRARTVFAYGNVAGGSQGYYVMRTNGICIDATNLLAEGIAFSNSVEQEIEFRLDGSCDSANSPIDLFLIEHGRAGSGTALTNVLTVYPLTGRVKCHKNY